MTKLLLLAFIAYDNDGGAAQNSGARLSATTEKLRNFDNQTK
jgi:hypothetical protein